MTRYLHAEQSEVGGKVKIILSGGAYQTCTEEDLIEFIESEGLNEDKILVGNNSESGHDPTFDTYKPVFIDPVTILDNFWEDICEKYYNYKWGKK